MSNLEFKELLEQSGINLFIPIDKLDLVLSIAINLIAVETQLERQLFYAAQAASLIESIVTALPESEAYYRNNPNQIYRMLLDNPRRLYKVVGNG